MSTASNYQTASSTPILADTDTVNSWSKGADGSPGLNMEPADRNGGNDAIHDGNGRYPSETDREQAQRIFDEIEEAEICEPSAAWLGSPDRALVRKAYMEFFGWSNMNILAALRSLCSKITLKGETQQVDRILDAFSSRWC